MFYDISAVAHMMPVPYATYPITQKGVDKELTDWFYLTDKPTFQFFLIADIDDGKEYRRGDFITVSRVKATGNWMEYFRGLLVLNSKGTNRIGYISPGDNPDSIFMTCIDGLRLHIKCRDISKAAVVDFRYRRTEPYF